MERETQKWRWTVSINTVFSVLLPLKAQTLKENVPIELNLLDSIVFSVELICGNVLVP